MQLRDAQRDMRRAYVNGGVGIFVSGLVWVIAGAVTFYVNLFSGMATLFLGGMLIHPLSLFLARRVYHRAKGACAEPFGDARAAIYGVPLHWTCHRLSRQRDLW
jgi:hypothetical protein